ncbi:hypothetical protein BOX15_Mlig027308g1, partial [Macrostomum lignano]
PQLRQLNNILVCSLCAGYLIDATRLTDCFHVFCKSCIVGHLQTVRPSRCPECGQELKLEEEGCLRQDRVLQDLVYKLVPGLRASEVHRRLDFSLELEKSLPLELATPVQIALSPRGGQRQIFLLLAMQATIGHVAGFLCDQHRLSATGTVDIYRRNTRLPAYWSLAELQKLRCRETDGQADWRDPIALTYVIADRDSAAARSSRDS